MDKSVRFVKRLMDVVGSTIGLAATAPALPFIALAIYLDSPGPVLLRQRRAGELVDDDDAESPRFVEFDMFKFRSMIPDAEKLTGEVLAAKDDPRVTRVGRFLRKTRLDELPQLWNVLKGDMSIVGPRPERPERQVNLALAIPFFEERMRGVRPGITGLAQTSLNYTGRAQDGSAIKAFEEALVNPFALDFVVADDDEDQEALAEADDMRMKLLFDLPYVASLERLASFLQMDLSIILKTPRVMLAGLTKKSDVAR